LISRKGSLQYYLEGVGKKRGVRTWGTRGLNLCGGGKKLGVGVLEGSERKFVRKQKQDQQTPEKDKITEDSGANLGSKKFRRRKKGLVGGQNVLGGGEELPGRKSRRRTRV